MIEKMKRILFFGLGMFLMALSGSAQTNVVDEVIWVVGDDPILLSDVEETRISAEMDKMPFSNPYCEIPEQIAIQKLFLHQAELDSVEISESAIISFVDEKINLYLQTYGSRENVEMIARKPLSQFREQLRQQTREGEMVRTVQRNLTSNIRVTPAEVRDYFKDMPEDSLPFVPTQVEVQIITYVPTVSRSEVERIEGQLREYARRVNSGESDFSTLAMLYSQDAASARQGGELDYSGKNAWVPEFSNVAFSLNDPKKVSKIVRTEYGFHIIQFVDRRGDKIKVRHILLKPEIEDSEYAKGMARLDSVAADIRDGKFTFDEAATVLSDDKDTRNNHGLMVNKNEETLELSSRFEMKDLPPDVARVVENMQVGEISPAFRLTPDRGQEVCAIVRLKNRIEGHHANITEDYQIMKDVVWNKRSAEKIDQWIREKQKSTFVRINSDWRNCEFKYPGWVR